MTSPLPPRLRDTRSLVDRVRQDRANLKQLSTGFVGGRFPLARPLGSTSQFGDIEDDATDDENTQQMAGWNTDQATCVTAGTITLPLTYVPIDGTLHVRWDGDDLHPTEWTLAGQSIIFTDPHIHVGDKLTAAYFYYPADVTEPDPATPLASLTLRGVTTDGTLPTATQVGDTIVVASQWADSGSGHVDYTDSRMAAVGLGGSSDTNVWIGIATDLTALAFTNTAFRASIVVAAFVETTAVAGAATNTGSSSTSTPQLAGIGAVVGLMDWHNVVVGGSSVPAPWTLAVNATNGLVHATIYYWFDSGAALTPASAVSTTGAVGGVHATVVALRGTS